MPLASRILDNRSWTSRTWVDSKQGIGRLLLALSMPFNSDPDCISPTDVVRAGFLLSCTAGSKAPYMASTLNFLSPSSHARSSRSSTSASSLSTHESGSLKIFSAVALSGTPLRKEVNGVDDIKGEAGTSSSRPG
jgi:hypothetical protein